MRLLAYVMMTVFLVLGTLAATTAYSPSLSLPDEDLIGLTLNADAGVALKDDFLSEIGADPGDTNELVRRLVETRSVEARAEAVRAAYPDHPAWALELEAGEVGRRAWGARVEQDAEITPALLGELRDMGVGRVRVKEFAIGRWQHAWLMGVACLGLLVSAVILKLHARAEIAAKLASADAGDVESPEQSIAGMRRTLEAVTDALPTLSTPHEKMELILDRIGGLQWTHTQAILDSRATLIGRLKLGGYAQFMDRFSAFERQLNRAWSAAADGALEESVTALEGARELLPQVEEKLQRGG